MQNLLGAEATGGVPFDTIDGQNVIYVGGAHFIGSHSINYDLIIDYENASHMVPLASYPAFNNTPDERYPQMDFLTNPDGCEIDVLFESDYLQNGSTHLLGYTKQCASWASKIFVYQPGEYQPNALTAGNNFQILHNAIYYLTDGRAGLLFEDSFESTMP